MPAKPSTAHLFVDTNFLLQCRPPTDLDWSPWKNFTEVRLIVSKPVLREIDSLKNRGKERRSRRARSASANFRKILRTGPETLHATAPLVSLRVEPHHSPSQELEDQLDYNERDDQLVGTVHAFAKSHPQAHVCLLTHDTTPTFTAKSLGLKYKLIPDDWLLPPENTKTEKELNALRLENARLKRAEPSFHVESVDETGKGIEMIELRTHCYEPLTSAEIDTVMRGLRQVCPPATDFGPQEIEERCTELFGTLFVEERVFEPATREEISTYKDKTYPEWTRRCEEILADCYRVPRQSPPPLFSFIAENHGTRPAADALVTIEVEGDFLIMPPASDRERADDGELARSKESARRLPGPPASPKGKWHITQGPRTHLDEAASVLKASGIRDALQSIAGFESKSLTPDLWIPPSLPAHDSNAFYYHPSRPTVPTRRLRLVCDQWRHMAGEECFGGRIIIRPDQFEIRGALLFRVQAENLSEPMSRRLPVRIEIDHVSSIDRANRLVAELRGELGETAD